MRSNCCCWWGFLESGKGDKNVLKTIVMAYLCLDKKSSRLYTINGWIVRLKTERGFQFLFLTSEEYFNCKFLNTWQTENKGRPASPSSAAGRSLPASVSRLDALGTGLSGMTLAFPSACYMMAAESLDIKVKSSQILLVPDTFFVLPYHQNYITWSLLVKREAGKGFSSSSLNSGRH